MLKAYCVLFIQMMLMGTSLWATPRAPAATPVAARVIILRTASTATARLHEKQYITELALTLEGITVAPETAPAGFSDLPLPRQIELVRALLNSKGVLAISWITESPRKSLFLHMVVMHSNRTLVRMLRGDPSRKSFAVDLAMASKELLGEAYLFSKTTHPKGPLKKIVTEVRQKVAPRLPSKWSIWGAGLTTGGIWGGKGAYLSAGGVVALEQRIHKNLKLRYSFSLMEGVWGNEIIPINGRTIAPGIGTSYKWKRGDLEFGPTLDLTSAWSRYLVDATPQVTQGFDHWRVDITAGFELHYPLLLNLGLFVGAYTSLSSRRQSLILESTGQEVFASPRIRWQINGGVLLAF